MNRNQTCHRMTPDFPGSRGALDPLLVREQDFYSPSGSSWSGEFSCEGWDWTESARLRSPQRHCSSQTQKSRGLHTGSTPWWSLCRRTRSGPRSGEKIAKTHVCVWPAHVCRHTCLPPWNKTQPPPPHDNHGVSPWGQQYRGQESDLIQFLRKNRYRGLDENQIPPVNSHATAGCWHQCGPPWGSREEQAQSVFSSASATSERTPPMRISHSQSLSGWHQTFTGQGPGGVCVKIFATTLDGSADVTEADWDLCEVWQWGWLRWL